MKNIEISIEKPHAARADIEKVFVEYDIRKLKCTDIRTELNSIFSYMPTLGKTIARKVLEAAEFTREQTPVQWSFYVDFASVHDKAGKTWLIANRAAGRYGHECSASQIRDVPEFFKLGISQAAVNLKTCMLDLQPALFVNPTYRRFFDGVFYRRSVVSILDQLCALSKEQRALAETLFLLDDDREDAYTTFQEVMRASL